MNSSSSLRTPRVRSQQPLPSSQDRWHAGVFGPNIDWCGCHCFCVPARLSLRSLVSMSPLVGWRLIDSRSQNPKQECTSFSHVTPRRRKKQQNFEWRRSPGETLMPAYIKARARWEQMVQWWGVNRSQALLPGGGDKKTLFSSCCQAISKIDRINDYNLEITFISLSLTATSYRTIKKNKHKVSPNNYDEWSKRNLFDSFHWLACYLVYRDYPETWRGPIIGHTCQLQRSPQTPSKGTSCAKRRTSLRHPARSDALLCCRLLRHPTFSSTVVSLFHHNMQDSLVPKIPLD